MNTNLSTLTLDDIEQFVRNQPAGHVFYPNSISNCVLAQLVKEQMPDQLRFVDYNNVYLSSDKEETRVTIPEPVRSFIVGLTDERPNAWDPMTREEVLDALVEFRLDQFDPVEFTGNLAVLPA